MSDINFNCSSFGNMPDADVCGMHFNANCPDATDAQTEGWFGSMRDEESSVVGGPITAITVNADTNPPFAGQVFKSTTTVSGKGWSATATWTSVPARADGDLLVKGDVLSATFAIKATGAYYFDEEEKADPSDPTVYKDVSVTIANTTSSTKTVTLTPTDDKTLPTTSVYPFPAITAVSYTLTTNVTPVGSGTVTRDPDLPKIEGGETVELTASPAGRFLGWNGAPIAGSTNPVETFVMPNNAVAVTARFSPPPPAPKGFQGAILNSTGGIALLDGQNFDMDFEAFLALPMFHKVKEISPVNGWNTWLTDDLIDVESRAFWVASEGTNFEVWDATKAFNQTAAFQLISFTVNGVLYKGRMRIQITESGEIHWEVNRS